MRERQETAIILLDNFFMSDLHIQGVPGARDKTSGEGSLC